MSSIVLENTDAKVVILPHRGALISSYQVKSQIADQLLWMPPNFDETSSAWPGGGLPFLFPFAGRVWHHGQVCHYALQDHIFPMPLHGFSWGTKWQVTPASGIPAKTAQQVQLELRSDENSIRIFPFAFHISMSIELVGKDLRINVAIKHIKPLLADAILMPVAAGWHPYFALAKAHNSISIPSATTYAVTPQGGAGKSRSTQEHLGHSPWALPNADLQSLILSDLQQPNSLLSREGLLNIDVSAGPKETMQHVVTWTNQPSEFHCIEPWMSLPDAVATPSGCRWLQADEEINIWFHLSPRIV